jgi:apolipoprotein D and lipocalin family protein
MERSLRRVARDARDYAWIMARTPTISPADHDALIARVVDMGYTAKNIRKLPQQWPDGAGGQREGSG